MNDELSKKISEQIETKNFTPLPRWRFCVWRGFFWLLAIFSVLVGSLAVGAVLFLWADFRSHGLLRIPHDFAELLLVVPYIWVLVFILFLIIARASIRQTRKGYRYRLRTILLANVILSFIFGYFLALAGVGAITHRLLSQVPGYHVVTYDARDAWNRAIAGRLAGVILEVKDSNNFSVVDFGGHIWQVHMATSTGGDFVPEASSTVRMSGLFNASSSVFVASFVHCWEDE